MTTFSGGERVGMPAHAAHRAPHSTPQPLIGKRHPATAHLTKASEHAARKTRRRGAGTHHRATIVAAGNPATVQIHGSDVATLWPLAQHVSVGSLAAGGTVVGIVLDPANPNDALLTAVY